ncbi:uncharacterized protein LOC112185371 isoform X2 [Rosa chinensis]|uniref:uncharacterized protein LOC112185371 isoform X2 n=1 Tax=Rosa chinensis TaxID=74649 RepID=UPI000D0889C0|nr:uncharacterized protein LOC112185371 isoform X2 [Rosa chinensis]
MCIFWSVSTIVAAKFVGVGLVFGCSFWDFFTPLVLQLRISFPKKVMSVKALGTALKLTFEGKNQLIYPETWFFMLVVTTCIITQMNYLNKILDSGEQIGLKHFKPIKPLGSGDTGSVHLVQLCGTDQYYP